MNKFSQTDIKSLINNGPSEAQAWQSNIDFTEMVVGMRNAQKGFRQTEIVSLVTALPESKTARKILDLGGATGIIGLSIAKENPDMSCVIYDMPPMEDAIGESIRQLGLSGRAEAMTGDFTKDDIGGGYDIILACASMNFAKPCIDTVMIKVYNALNENGVFICISDGVSADGTYPPEVVVGWLPYALAGMDIALPKGFVSDAAQRNGFTRTYKETRLMATGISDIDIIRK